MLTIEAGRTRRRLGPYEYEKEKGIPRDIRTPACFKNGNVYIGEWSDKNRRHGKGTLYQKDGGIYEGYWTDGHRTGRGRAIFPNGEAYDGDWKNDKRHGSGVFHAYTGALYEG